MTSSDTIAVGDYLVDIEFDFGNEDQTGNLWTWLHKARNPAEIYPGAVLTLRDGEDLAMGQVIDLVPAANGTMPFEDPEAPAGKAFYRTEEAP